MNDRRNADSVQASPLRDALLEVLTRWRLLIALPIVGAIGAGLFALVVPPRYDSVAIFNPAEDVSASLPSNLQSIAAQFGVAPAASGYNVYYFAQVLQSRAVLIRVVDDTLIAGDTVIAVTATLGTEELSAPRRTEATIKALQNSIRVRTDDQAELVTLRVRGRSPEIANSLAGAILAALDSVTTESIRRGGSSERLFAQAQADSAGRALNEAEDRLRDFYNANRSIVGSPSLQSDEARLRRQIQIRQDLYLTLVSQAEAAKLREVKNTPAIGLVQPPQASARRAWPKPSVWAISVAIGLFTVVLAWLYLVGPLLPAHRVPRWMPVAGK
jgi:uncharacterized protein involved in exopolysaccharide biosynthesis